MCKSIKTKFYDKLTFEKLLEAEKRAKKGKGNKKEILKYEMNLEINIMNLYNSLKNGTYKMGKYREFIIYEPKERIIKSLPFNDRIVHQWYIEEFIKPYILKRFINDSYACIDKKGTHLAIKKLQKYIRENKDCYVLKCDIKKYFQNINKNILFSIMKRYIKNQELLELTKIFIFDNEEEINIPIGNYTSQYFANIYLNEFDYFVKHKLRIKSYERFMDDSIFLIKNKQEAKIVLEKIKKYLNETLKLELNKKTCYYPSYKGIDFCGYIVYNTHILIRKRSIKKIKRKINKWNKLYNNNQLDYHKFILCFNSFKGHIKHANSYNLYNKLCEKLEFEY